jgi:hypothetical protein
LVIPQIAELTLRRDVLAVTLLGDSLLATVALVVLFFLGAFGDTSRFDWARLNLVHHPGSLQSKALHILGEGGLQLFHRLRHFRRQRAHTVLECDLQSTSDSSPLVVTTAST